MYFCFWYHKTGSFDCEGHRSSLRLQKETWSHIRLKLVTVTVAKNLFSDRLNRLTSRILLTHQLQVRRCTTGDSKWCKSQHV